MENLEFLASESLSGFAKTVVSWFRLTTNNNKYCDKTRENLALLAPNTDSQRVMRIYLAPILHPSCTHLAPKFLKCRLVSCANCLIHSIYDDNPLFRKLMIIFLTLFGFSGFFGIHLLIPKTSKITKKTKISVESVKSV